MVFDYIEKYQHRAKQILGISYKQLKSLLNCARQRHQEIKTKQESRKIRINAAAGGRPEKLLIQKQVCLCLFYLRQPTFQVLGMLLSVSKTEANDTFHEWIPILRDILPLSLLEQVSNNESDLLFSQEVLTNFRLLVDSLEQPIYRNCDQKEQQKYFSGKKRQHTLKSLMIIGIPEAKDIVEVEIVVPGATADINLFRKSQEKFDKSQPFAGDKGFQGGKNISSPHKRKPKRELTQEQKDENKALSSNRIFIEHLIRLLKIFRDSQKFRLKLDTYEQIILTVCGLVRLRINSLILPT